MSRLLTIRTDLSDYKAPQYGYDRRGAGPHNTNASGQPYELTEIPKRSFSDTDFNGGTNKQFEDFILRGGQLLPETVTKDASRLFKMFSDLKSPNGLLFTGKQEVLSRTSVNIKAVSNTPKPGFFNFLGDSNRLPLNNGIYLPTSTLAQAIVNPVGGHLLKQGINPLADTSESSASGTNILGFLNRLPLRNPIYFETDAQKERFNTDTTTSRLVDFTNNKINTQNSGKKLNELYNYSGGPNSILGVGKSRVTMVGSTRTGLNNPELKNNGFFSTGKTPNTNFGFDYSVFKGGVTNSNFETFKGGTYFGNIYNSGSKTVTGKYSSFTNTPLFNLLGTKNLTFKTVNDDINGAQMSLVGQSVYQNGFENNPSVKGLGTTLTYNQLMVAKGTGSVNVITDNNEYLQTEILKDFRQKTPTPSVGSLDYTLSTNRYEERVHLGNAGAKNKTTSYVTGNNTALDKINALQIYKSSNVNTSKEINDLCKFRIGVIDNDNPELKTYIHFRAFLDSMDDSYTADWSAQKFAGRAENLYNYQGFDRKFGLSWTVVAQSKQELIPMYQKLNYLASICAPDYSSDGYMRGNLIELTVGGYLFNQVGIMTGINYTVPMESPWEISIPDTQLENEVGFLSDGSVKELPFMIKVSGFNFIPIHSFVPNVQKNTFANSVETEFGTHTEGNLSTYGDEKYIALSNGVGGDSYTPKKGTVTNFQVGELQDGNDFDAGSSSPFEQNIPA